MGSCRENTLINSNLSPANSTIGVFDTSLAVTTSTRFDDSAVTSLNFDGTGLPIYVGVGTLSDPYFGTMRGEAYFQLTPTNFTNAVFTGGTITSAELVLPYDGFTYGDSANTSLTQDYQVFYMTDTLGDPDNVRYYSFSSKPVDDASPLSEIKTVNLRALKDSAVANGKKYAPSLRIPLILDRLTAKLLPALANLATATNPSTAFNEAFKGICVRPVGPAITTAMPYFRLNGTGPVTPAGIIVYYKNSSNVDTSQFYYFNTASTAHFNKVTKDYSSAEVNTLFASTANDSIAGIQNTPGAIVKVVIPGLKSLPQGVINKAELQLVVLPWRKVTTLSQPGRIYPQGIGNGIYPSGIAPGVAYNVADRYPLTSSSVFGILDGLTHNITRNGKTVEAYTLGIPREVMTAIAAKSDTILLRIEGSQDYAGARRVIVGGGTHPDSAYQAKLFVVYSALKKN